MQLATRATPTEVLSYRLLHTILRTPYKLLHTLLYTLCNYAERGKKKLQAGGDGMWADTGAEGAA